jgi:tellurite resistance protein
MKKEMNLTLPEAALVLSVDISLADDDPSEAEAVVLRKYFRMETAESLQKIMTDAGFAYPAQIKELLPSALTALKKAEKAFRLWTLAVAYELAQADGNYDRQEMLAISGFAADLECPMFEIRIFAEKYLREISGTDDYTKIHGMSFSTASIDLTEEEAGLALSVLVSFSDDDPSNREIAVVREFYSSDAALSLTEKMGDNGYSYPDDLKKLTPSIIKALSCYDRNIQLKHLAIAYRTANADGQLSLEELAILKEICSDLYIGIGELADFFKATV